jgi:diguanylate cyclase (GGDEF)-like protein
MALGLGEIALEHLREESGFPHAYMSFTLVIVAQYYHSRLPFPMVCACGWTLFGAKYVCLMLDDPSSTYAVYAAALGIIANAIGMLAALEYESSMRNEFKHRTRLKQLAERDGLTGLYNRRVMEGMLPALWQQAITERCSLVVMMVDIDHFKPYNDMLGHPRGDECLKRVAEILSKLARRPNDFCTRYGGEEFCIIYYGVDSEFADDMAEAIRNSVRASALPHPASSIADVVTVSVGAVSCQPRIGIGPSDLIERADSALYEAKHRGRDQYVVDVL